MANYGDLDNEGIKKTLSTYTGIGSTPIVGKNVGKSGGGKSSSSAYSAPTYQRQAYPTLDYKSAYSQAAAQLDPAAQILKQRNEKAYAQEKEKLPQYLNARGQAFGGARILGEENIYDDYKTQNNEIDLQNNAAISALTQTLMAKAQARADTMEAQDYNRWSDGATRQYQLYRDTVGDQQYANELAYKRETEANDYEISQQSATQKALEAEQDAAFKRWTYSGVVQPGDEQLLGVPAGTPTNDATYKAAQLVISDRNSRKSSGSGGGTKKPTVTEQNAATTKKAVNWVGSHWDMFNDSPANMGAQVQKNMESGNFDISIGNAILKYLKDNYSN